MTKLLRARVIFEHFDENNAIVRETEEVRTVYVKANGTARINYLGGYRPARRCNDDEYGDYRCFGSKRHSL